MPGLLNVVNDELIALVEQKWLNVYRGQLYQNIKLIRFLRKVKTQTPFLKIPERLKAHIKENQAKDDRLRNEWEQLINFKTIVDEWEQRLCKRLDKLRHLKKDEWGQVTIDKLIANKEIFEEPLVEYEDIIINYSMGTWNFQSKHLKLIKLCYKSVEFLIKEFEIFSHDTLLGDFVRSLPGQSEKIRLEAASRLSKNYFSRPIYNKRWRYLDQEIRQELSRRVTLLGEPPKNLINLSILTSVFSLPSAILKKAKEKKLGDSSLAELEKKPEILKTAMADLTTNDLVGSWWRDIYRELPFKEEKESTEEEEGLHGELEIAATILRSSKKYQEWLWDEINDLNTELVLQKKLESLRLTPGEQMIIKAKLAGKEPKGTPGAIKTAISRLRDKAKKK